MALIRRRFPSFQTLSLALLYSVPAILKAGEAGSSLDQTVLAGLGRLFANPASTVENLFYFGFLTERLAQKGGRWLTPLLIAGMYTVHEMSNPEYWYSGMSFGLVFVGLVLALPAGVILQRLGPKATSLIALGSMAAGGALGALADRFGVLMISRVIEGAGMGLIGVAAPTTIAMWFPPDRQGRRWAFGRPGCRSGQLSCISWRRSWPVLSFGSLCGGPGWGSLW